MSDLRDKIRAKRQQIQDKSAGNERSFKLPVGKTFFRLLPGVGEVEDFYQEIGIHWIKDANGKVITAVGDREICYGEPCPIRQAIDRFIKVSQDNGDDKGIERGKDMLAKSRFYVNAEIVKCSGEFEKGKPVILDLPQSVFDSILSQIDDMLEDIPADGDLSKVGPFAFASGPTFVIEKTGSGKETRYNAYIAATTKAVPVKPDIMASAVDLAAFKRSQFDGRIRKALVALGDMIGTDLVDIADRLAAPASVRAAIAGPSDDDVADGEIIEMEADKTESAVDDLDEAPISDDDILADLDDL